MGILDNSGGFSPGFSEGVNSKMAEEEHHQKLDKISKQELFGMEGQVENVWKYLVG